jgi:hypothetical protein
MSYANRSWVSDYTWRALLNSFASASSANATAASASPASVSPAGIEAGNSVFVSGLVDTGAERGEITSVLVLPNTSLPPATRQGPTCASLWRRSWRCLPHADYTLRLLDSAGALLLNQPLTLSEMDDHVGDSDSALFSAVFAQPAGQVATIQLLADANVLDTIAPGINPPGVAIQQPSASALIDASLTHPVERQRPRPQATSCSSPCNTATTTARRGTRSPPTIQAALSAPIHSHSTTWAVCPAVRPTRR